MAKIGDDAVVLGASMAGLLAARTLSDFFETVTVVERDVLPDDAANRRGVPQGRHLHALLARGAQVLEELFPGLLDELVTDGVPYFDGRDLSKLYYSLGGHQGVRPGHSGIQSRLAASLIVDATGRGARTPALLENLGYGRPIEDHVSVHLTYT